MNIDTLVLSGGSTKVPAFIGCFKALREYNIVDDNLTGIKHIISCSVGMLYALLLLLKINDNIVEEIIKKLCFSELLDLDNLNIHNLLFELGLFDNQKVATIITTILREVYDKEKMNLQELYDLTHIKLTAKVVNHTKSCIEYISYENEPKLSICTLLLMTTAIPLFFKPIPYNDCLYVDGGAAGGFAIEIAGENYIGIQLKGPNKTDNKSSLCDDLPIIKFIISGIAISPEDTSKPDHRNIVIPSTIHFSNFKLSLKEKQTLIDDGYKLTKKHILKYKLTNSHLVDKAPIEEN
jgi:hypothetical protein